VRAEESLQSIPLIKQLGRIRQIPSQYRKAGKVGGCHKLSDQQAALLGKVAHSSHAKFRLIQLSTLF
jgi:hypothetical protein